MVGRDETIDEVIIIYHVIVNSYDYVIRECLK